MNADHAELRRLKCGPHDWRLIRIREYTPFEHSILECMACWEQREILDYVRALLDENEQLRERAEELERLTRTDEWPSGVIYQAGLRG